MTKRSQFAFLILVIAHAAHSIEEYTNRLYEVFAPARLISGFFSDDLEIGFVIVNGSFVALGLLCYLAFIRPEGASARAWAWLLVAIEALNGAGHLVIAIRQEGYFPGALTAPLLIGVALWLGALLVRDPGKSQGASAQPWKGRSRS